MKVALEAIIMGDKKDSLKSWLVKSFNKYLTKCIDNRFI